MGNWTQHVTSWTAAKSPAIHIMRYEDMLDDATAAFAGLTAFMRVETTPEKIARAVRHAAFDEARKMEAASGFVERTPAQNRFFRSGRAGTWRDVLHDDQVARVVEAHRTQMMRFDYLPEGF